MKSPVAGDDFTTMLLFQEIVGPYGECHITAKGREAIDAYQMARQEGKPYDLYFLDIMMPGMEGQEVQKGIRRHEDFEGISLGMTTASKDRENIFSSFMRQCDEYLVKPINKSGLLQDIIEFGFIE